MIGLGWRGASALLLLFLVESTWALNPLQPATCLGVLSLAGSKGQQSYSVLQALDQLNKLREAYLSGEPRSVSPMDSPLLVTGLPTIKLDQDQAWLLNRRIVTANRSVQIFGGAEAIVAEGKAEVLELIEAIFKQSHSSTQSKFAEISIGTPKEEMSDAWLSRLKETAESLQPGQFLYEGRNHEVIEQNGKAGLPLTRQLALEILLWKKSESAQPSLIILVRKSDPRALKDFALATPQDQLIPQSLEDRFQRLDREQLIPLLKINLRNALSHLAIKKDLAEKFENELLDLSHEYGLFIGKPGWLTRRRYSYAKSYWTPRKLGVNVLADNALSQALENYFGKASHIPSSYWQRRDLLFAKAYERALASVEKTGLYEIVMNQWVPLAEKAFRDWQKVRNSFLADNLTKQRHRRSTEIWNQLKYQGTEMLNQLFEKEYAGALIHSVDDSWDTSVQQKSQSPPQEVRTWWTRLRNLR